MQVSVIVPTRNSERFLPEALASVGRQSEIELELLVVDAGSSDRSITIAQSFGAIVMQQPGRGLSDAWNTGIQASSCPFVAMLDSDDVWIPDTLGPRVEILCKRPGPRICMGGVQHFLADAVERPAGFRRDLFERSHIAPIPGAMLIDRRIFGQVGWFNVDLVTAGDADWVARAVNHGVEFCEFPELVLRKRVHQTNLTRDTATVNAEMLDVLRRSIRQKRKLRD